MRHTSFISLACGILLFAGSAAAEDPQTEEQRDDSQQVAQSGTYDGGMKPATPGLFLRLTGAYLHTAVNNLPNSDAWRANGTATFPFDFGLTDGGFLDALGWRVSAEYVRTENTASTYTGFVSPFWRNPDIGYVEPSLTVSTTNFDSSVRPLGNRNDDSISAGVTAGTYLLDNFDIGAFGSFTDTEAFDLTSFGAFGRYFPPFEPLDGNLAVTLGAAISDIDFDRPRPDSDRWNINYRAEYLLFPEQEGAVSLFVGGVNRFIENGPNNFTVIAGFTVWIGPEPGNLYERTKMY